MTCVRASNNKRFVISLGGPDRSILIWRHEVELISSSDIENGDDGKSHSSNYSGGSSDGEGVMISADLSKEIADVGIRSPLQEAVNHNCSNDEIVDLIEASMPTSGGDDFMAVKPWKSAISEPTVWNRKDSQGSTDVDLTLQWVHGYRSFDCRNNLRYSAAGKIVFTAATIGVAYSKATGKQQFLQGAHNDEVLGIAAHPNGQIFATGEAGNKPTIIVWHSQDMRVLARIEGAHERGIPLLAFSTRGNLLASIGLDGNNTLVLHDWANGIEIMRTPTEIGKIFSLSFLDNPNLIELPASIGGGGSSSSSSASSSSSSSSASPDIIVTGGEKHLKFWWSQGQNVKSQRGLWGKEKALKRDTIMCVASAYPKTCVTGSVNGNLVVFRAAGDKDFKVQKLTNI